ncbi:hypothetical protein QTP88_003142 [Uroleucon formosanum]
MAKRNEDIEIIIELLKLYRQHTALPKVKSTEYSDRNLKNEAYNVLIEKYKEVDPNADKEIVKKKINSLRTNYRKELKKLKASYKSESGTDDIYVPPLWYYNELNFLQDQEVPVDGLSTIILQSEDETQDDVDLSINAQEQNISEGRTEALKAQTGIHLKTTKQATHVSC